MDAAKSILTETVQPPMLLEQLKKINNIPEEKKKQYAKDFESVFISKLLDEMKNTVGDWGFEKDSDSKQTQGIFWLCLARDVADNGGLGLWKDICQFLTDSEHKSEVAGILDKNI